MTKQVTAAKTARRAAARWRHQADRRAADVRQPFHAAVAQALASAQRRGIAR